MFRQRTASCAGISKWAAFSSSCTSPPSFACAKLLVSLLLVPLLGAGMAEALTEGKVRGLLEGGLMLVVTALGTLLLLLLLEA
jgi:hypothetical protein